MRSRSLHFRLPFQAKGVCQTHQIVENAHNVDGLHKGFFSPSHLLQVSHILIPNLVGGQSQLFGKLQQSTGLRIQRSGAEISLDLPYQLRGSVFETEKLSVNLGSILAATSAGNYHCHHLPLLPGEGTGIPHEPLEELKKWSSISRSRE